MCAIVQQVTTQVNSESQCVSDIVQQVMSRANEHKRENYDLVIVHQVITFLIVHKVMSVFIVHQVMNVIRVIVH